MICNTCKSKTDVEKTITHRGKLLYGCDNCLTHIQQGTDGIAKFNREWQKVEYRKDLIQPTQSRDFVRAYRDKAKEFGYSDEMIRRLS